MRPSALNKCNFSRGAIARIRSPIAGATAPGPHVIVVRVLSPLVEPAIDLLKAVHAAWRPAPWSLAAVAPRLWAL